MICVVDASVAVKWFARGEWAEREGDLDAARWLLQATVSGHVDMLAPPHFLAEVGAVLARLTPESACRDVEELALLEISWAAPTLAVGRAVDLACQLHRHLYDTLYHALALETNGAVFVTADRRYFDRAAKLGHIAWLPDLPTDPRFVATAS